MNLPALGVEIKILYSSEQEMAKNIADYVYLIMVSNMIITILFQII